MEKRSDTAWKRAAQCEAHANGTGDKAVQRMFRKLRDSWIRIGNEAQFTDDTAQNASRMNDSD
jgi:hypothetical protein